MRAELPVLWSGWTIASWFAAQNVQLKGRSPADLLDSDFDAVMQAALWRQSGDGFALPVVRKSLGPGGVAAQA